MPRERPRPHCRRCRRWRDPESDRKCRTCVPLFGAACMSGPRAETPPHIQARIERYAALAAAGLPLFPTRRPR
jgi:hypothetical protein